MPSASGDEHAAELDEPPDHRQQTFQKSIPKPMISRRESLLTKAFHTDSESHDDELQSSLSQRQASRSSTCSNFSGRFDFTSDDGVNSAGTRASTPDPHPHPPVFTKPDYSLFRPTTDHQIEPQQKHDKAALHSATSPSKSDTSEPAVEAELGRKRCISFACGRANSKPAGPSPEPQPQKTTPERSARPCFIRFMCNRTSNESTKSSGAEEDKQETGPPRRPCIKFACPAKVGSSALDKDQRPKTSRHLSPPPPPQAQSPSPDRMLSLLHRDSDTTLRNGHLGLTKDGRKPAPAEPTATNKRNDTDPSEANEFHEFAGKDEKVEEWVRESTCHKSRLTVADTLKKENDIRQIGEEAEQEALAEEEADGELSQAGSEGEADSEEEVSDDGFQTDDEDGFAASDDDDESDGDSDYEWWAPRKAFLRGQAAAPSNQVCPPMSRTASESSLSSTAGAFNSKSSDTPRSRPRRRSQPQPVPPRSGTPELPDSTDFVCGTLDEDQPLEMAYASCIEQRKAAKHKAVPQDFDPTFPTDVSDDDEEAEDHHSPDEISDKDEFLHGSLENIHHEEPRGRKLVADKKPSPRTSPRRLKSPPPPKRLHSPVLGKGLKSPAPANQKRLHSPPPPRKLHSPPPPKRRTTHDLTKPANIHVSPPTPRRLFGDHSPRRFPSPLPTCKITSPPSSPTRRPSQTDLEPVQIPFGTAFLGARPTLTYTTSLPRSPNTFGRQTHFFTLSPRPHEQEDQTQETEDENYETAHENGSEPTYKRGAIDIVQGLEQRKMRCRQKFWEKFCQHKERRREKGDHKRIRPPPGKGAQRMRRIGIDCAEYRGKRVLSV